MIIIRNVLWQSTCAHKAQMLQHGFGRTHTQDSLLQANAVQTAHNCCIFSLSVWLIAPSLR